MARHDAGFIEISKRKFPIWVDDNGRWGHGDSSGESRVSGTRDGLRSALVHMLREASAEVEVRFTKCGSGGARPGTAYGIHQGNGNILARFDDGKKEQLERYTYSAELFRELSGEEVAELERLRQAWSSADNAYNQFKNERRIDLRAEVEAKIKEKLDAGDREQTA